MTDHNEQYMRSMGMDPSFLGAPVIPGVTWDKGMEYTSDRCGSFYGNMQCARVVGHEGTHARGTAKWQYGDLNEEPTKQRDGDQRLPIKSDRTSIQDLVIADVEARKQVGITRYGTALQPYNGRDTILDAYEEALDFTTYMRSLLEMRRATRDDLISVVFDLLSEDEFVQVWENPDRYDVAERIVDRILDALTTGAGQ